jgi:hypothetical protein
MIQFKSGHLNEFNETNLAKTNTSILLVHIPKANYNWPSILLVSTSIQFAK